ncbi:unnamed protein product [Clonostachys rhizophaga]|uniref:Rhodopsin domain-containing protein n=1 Tax=Clonostachys rhizophaga TaxID=160324 RepID=A0A9N9YQ22_9HYPO|nr:unnamed protein product [Clonostachys rhizophaga]
MVKRRILLWTTLGYIILCPIVTLIEMFRICIPLERNWTGDRCVVVGGMRLLRISWGFHFAGSLIGKHKRPFWSESPGYLILVIVFALPWLILPDLQLKGSLRMGVYYTFLLGLADIAVCLTRYIVIELAAAKRPPSMSLLQLFVALDYTLSLVIACLPSLRPYFRANQQTTTDKGSNPTQSTTTKKSDFGPTSLAERELMEDS